MLFGSFFTIPTLRAQTANPEATAGLIIQPAFPEPFEEITIQLNAYSYNLNSAGIDWFAAGETLSEFTNQREISYQVGDLGEPTIVTAVITQADGIQLSISETITPTRIDIIMEPQTFTATLYPGSPLPSVGSVLRVVALPQEKNYKSPNNYSYQWRLNNEIQFLGEIKSANVAEFIIPRGRVVIGVEALNTDGEVVAKKNILVPVTEPLLQFYVNNPLRGTSEYPIENIYELLETEVNIRAVPYGIAKDITASEHLLEWGLNNQAVTNPNPDPFEITLRKQVDGGMLPLNFHIRNLRQLSQGVEDDIVIRF